MNYAIEQKSSVKLSDGRWLLMGVALHVLILLIPLREWMPESLSQSAELVVQLVKSAQEELSDKVLPPPEFSREVLQPKPEIAEMVELGKPEEIEAKEPPREITDVSTSRLMGVRNSLTERVPLEDPSSNIRTLLGEPRPYSPPANWQPYTGAQAVAPFDNTFNGMTVPEDVQIVDRWVANDGSRNVVVETPSGHTLCGRATASDPMRPYIENVMHFHVCGGDGAIPFKFKPREPLNRDFIDPVAKDANQP